MIDHSAGSSRDSGRSGRFASPFIKTTRDGLRVDSPVLPPIIAMIVPITVVVLAGLTVANRLSTPSMPSESELEALFLFSLVLIFGAVVFWFKYCMIRLWTFDTTRQTYALTDIRLPLVIARRTGPIDDIAVIFVFDGRATLVWKSAPQQNNELLPCVAGNEAIMVAHELARALNIGTDPRALGAYTFRNPRLVRMDERVVAIRKQRPVRVISGVLSKLLSIGSLLAGGAITVAGGLHIGFHWALSYHPFAFLLGVYGVIALQLAGPEDLTIDRAARTYVLRQGMLYLAETQTGSLADIANFHVATGTPNGVPPNLVVQKAYLAVKWRNRRKMTVIGEFYDLDEAYAQARLFQDELALNLPIVSPDNRPR